MGRYGRRRGGYSTGEKLYMAGNAMSDFGELLGQYAYMQMQMKNIEDDNARRDAQLELDKKKMEIDAAMADQRIGETLNANMQKRGFGTEDEQAQAGMMMGLGPVQRVPGIPTEEEYKKQTWEDSFNKFKGDRGLSYEETPETAFSTTLSRHRQMNEAQAKAFGDVEVSKDTRMRTNLDKWRRDVGEEFGWSGSDLGRWVGKGEVPDGVKTQDLLGLAFKEKAFAAAQTQEMQINIDDMTASLVQSVNSGKLKYLSDEYMDEIQKINNMKLMKENIENGIMDGIPGHDKIMEALTNSGGIAQYDKQTTTDAQAKKEALRRKIQMLKSKELSTSPAQGALEGTGVNPSNFNLRPDLGM